MPIEIDQLITALVENAEAEMIEAGLLLDDILE